MEKKQPTCPRCRYEYQSWVEVCPDCGTLLEMEPQPPEAAARLDPQKDPQWSIVTNVPNAILGNFIKSQLEDVGIPVIMMRSRSADIAEFSHNDFVPQDLRVPLSYLQEARRIIDGAPSHGYGSAYDPFPAAVETDDIGEGQREGMPEGWTMLPTESSLGARHSYMRSHGESAPLRYWSDRSNADDYEDEEGVYSPRPYRGPDTYQMDYSYGPTRWVRVIYGLLLLALSLPFLIQIVSQLWQMVSKIP